MNFKVFLLLIFFACLLHTPDAFAGDGNTKNTSELSVDQYQKPKKRKYTKVGGSRKYRGPSITNRNKHYVRRKQYRRSGGMGSNILSGSMGSGLNYSTFMSFKGSYDYRINEQFSAGIQGSLLLQDVSIKLHKAACVGPRFNYHFLDQSQNFDLYLGTNIGVDIGLDEEGTNNTFRGDDPSKLKIFWDIHAGFRYKINNSWMPFVEISKRYSTIGISFAF